MWPFDNSEDPLTKGILTAFHIKRLQTDLERSRLEAEEYQFQKEARRKLLESELRRNTLANQSQFITNLRNTLTLPATVKKAYTDVSSQKLQDKLTQTQIGKQQLSNLREASQFATLLEAPDGKALAQLLNVPPGVSQQLVGSMIEQSAQNMQAQLQATREALGLEKQIDLLDNLSKLPKPVLEAIFGNQTADPTLRGISGSLLDVMKRQPKEPTPAIKRVINDIDEQLSVLYDRLDTLQTQRPTSRDSESKSYWKEVNDLQSRIVDLQTKRRRMLNQYGQPAGTLK